MMENIVFRWIAFGVCVGLAVFAVVLSSISGFLCFAVAAFILIPINHLFEMLDKNIDPKYRKRAVIITVVIFLVCGLITFMTELF